MSPPEIFTNNVRLYFDLDCNEFFLIIILVAFTAVEVILGKIDMFTHFEPFNLDKRHS